MEEGHYDEALKLLDGEREDPLVCLKKADIYQNLKNHTAALQQVNKGLEITPENWELLALRAKIEIENGDLLKARHDLTAAIDSRTLQLAKDPIVNSEKWWANWLPIKNKMELLRSRQKVNHALGDVALETADLQLVKELAVERERFKDTPKQFGSVSQLDSYLKSQEFLVDKVTRQPLTSEVYCQCKLNKISEDDLMKIMPGKPLGLASFPNLYKHRWGFLQITKDSETGKIDTASFRSPELQFSELLDSENKPRAIDKSKLLEEILISIAPASCEKERIIWHLAVVEKEYDLALKYCNSDEHILRAEILYEAGRYAEALRLLGKTSSTALLSAKEALLHTRTLIELKKFGEAKRVFDKYKNQKHRNANVHGWWQAGNGIQTEEVSIDLATEFYLRGQIRAGMKDIPGAMDDLREAIPVFYESAMIKERDKARKLLDELENPAAVSNGCEGNDILVVKGSNTNH